MGHGNIVDRVDIFRRLHFKRDHDAVADRGGLAIERHRRRNPRRPAPFAPRDEGFEIHHPPDAEMRGNRVIERRRARQIIGAKGNVADH